MNVIFASWGNDSVALIALAARMQMTDCVVAYSDTGWSAPYWPERVEIGEEWARGLGMQCVRIPSEGMESLVRRKKAWPRGGGGKFQFCTEELKQKPANAWLDSVDPTKDAVCMIGIRREESPNRATFPEWIEASPKHGGRSLYAPLVRHTEAQRDELLKDSPFDPLPHRSKECWPCVNAQKRELKHIGPLTFHRIERLEREMGINSKGNARVMFSPARHNGAVGIFEVIEDARNNTDDIFDGICDGGWCGS